MTKVILQIGKDGRIYFDCMNHAGDKYVCAMISTLCKVLLAACERAEITSIAIEDAHVKIDIEKASPALTEQFRAVRDVFYELEEEYPFQVKIY